MKAADQSTWNFFKPFQKLHGWTENKEVIKVIDVIDSSVLSQSIVIQYVDYTSADLCQTTQKVHKW